MPPEKQRALRQFEPLNRRDGRESCGHAESFLLKIGRSIYGVGRNPCVVWLLVGGCVASVVFLCFGTDFFFGAALCRVAIDTLLSIGGGKAD